MLRLSLFSLLFLVGGLTASAAELVGKITDVKCGSRYKSLDHAACAQRCVHLGERYALLTDDDKVWQLMAKKGESEQSISDKIDQWVDAGAKRLRITGICQNNFIIVEKIEDADQ